MKLFRNKFLINNHDTLEEQLIGLALSKSPTFLSRFQSAYPDFHRKITEAHPHLTESDLELCYMTLLRINTKDMAKIYNIKFRSVQTKRSRLRKKMNVSPQLDFGEYLQDFL